jgi:hypothetical protein
MTRLEVGQAGLVLVAEKTISHVAGNRTKLWEGSKTEYPYGVLYTPHINATE